MSSPPLPAVGNSVELWFSGYDQYYSGTVESVSPPDSFSVLLEDGTLWPVDRVNNIWRYKATPPPPAPAPGPAPPPPAPAAYEEEEEEDRAPLAPPPPAPAPPALPAPKQPPRRKSGRAFRKSTGPPAPPAPRPVEPDLAPPPVAPERRRPAPDDVEARASRAGARQRRVVADEDSSAPVTPVRPVRRGRPPAAGQKRPAADAGIEQAWDDAAEKRRRKADVDALANGVPAPPAPAPPATAVERVTRSGARREDDAVEKLSTKAVTAIAVEAALASAKAVLKPLNDQLIGLRAELESISAAAKRAAEDLSVEGGRKRRGGKTIDSAVSAAALEALQLDLSELVGGGEARIRAYAHLSDKEFEGFHKTIEEQFKSLKELDRLLYAAQELGKKAEKNAARDARASRKHRRG